MFFFKKKEVPDDSLSDKSRFSDEDILNDCVILQSVLQDQLLQNIKLKDYSKSEIESILVKIESIRQQIFNYEKEEKSLLKRISDVKTAIMIGRPIVLTNDEISAISTKKKNVKESVAFISVGGMEKVQVTHDIVIGRSIECDIHVSDQAVSRNHVKIFKRDDGFWIMDMGSKNGTFVDGKQLLPENHSRLLKSSIITIGNTTVFFAFLSPL